MHSHMFMLTRKLHRMRAKQNAATRGQEQQCCHCACAVAACVASLDTEAQNSALYGQSSHVPQQQPPCLAQKQLLCTDSRGGARDTIFATLPINRAVGQRMLQHESSEGWPKIMQRKCKATAPISAKLSTNRSGFSVVNFLPNQAAAHDVSLQSCLSASTTEAQEDVT
mmetsp:Transcript_14175/g.28022  ORF Transcript_14175/g.28022 Transcript_14175/m.28022 type:complete len:168 (-) Transcript_14175:337-840(-)